MKLTRRAQKSKHFRKFPEPSTCELDFPQDQRHHSIQSDKQQHTFLTVRMKHPPTTKNAIRNGFFHLFDLIGLDEERVPPHAGNRSGGILRSDKGQCED
jgi:hypothetical protein